MDKKVCPVCEKNKNIDEFYHSKKRVHSWCKKCLCANQSKRWIERKIEAIKMFGGKCNKCGYCRNYTALEFHHLDPKSKDFNWCSLRQMKWEEIIVELKKCILLCANCHRETHWPGAIIENYETPTIESVLNRKNEMEPTGTCPICGKEVYRTKYCSVECSSMSKRKATRPSKNKLHKLLKSNPTTEVARSYGVSDNAVKKWAKSYGIWQPRRDSNPE
jgi:hypothetical protein